MHFILLASGKTTFEYVFATKHFCIHCLWPWALYLLVDWFNQFPLYFERYQAFFTYSCIQYIVKTQKQQLIPFNQVEQGHMYHSSLYHIGNIWIDLGQKWHDLSPEKMVVATNIIDHRLQFRFGRIQHRYRAGFLHDFVHLDFLTNP